MKAKINMLREQKVEALDQDENEESWRDVLRKIFLLPPREKKRLVSVL